MVESWTKNLLSGMMVNIVIGIKEDAILECAVPGPT